MKRITEIICILGIMIALAGCDIWSGTKPADQVPAPSGYVHPNPQVEQWHHAALVAGWSEAEWPVLACIMQHPVHTDIGESMGFPDVYNGRLNDKSYGLLQLNTRGSLWNFYKNLGVAHRDDLRDGPTNLRAGKLLSISVAAHSWSDHDKWQPWRGSWSRYRAECFRMEGAVA